MGCPDENLIVELLQGELEGAKLESLESHLDACPACMALVVELARMLPSSEDAGAHQEEHSEPDEASEHDRYEILERVGEGGMGIVYRALDTRLGRYVALKVLRSDLEESSDLSLLGARLEQEARLIAGLSHPNVLTVHDVGRWGARVYLAAEFVEGATLREWVASTDPGWKEVVELFIQAGRGLTAAHEAGLVHRDIKPDNLMVGDDGRVRVTDFGLARALSRDGQVRDRGQRDGVSSSSLDDELSGLDTKSPMLSFTLTGDVFGTPAYMSPEQHQGQSAGPSSDQYSFCAALFESVHGCRPFEEESYSRLEALKRAGRLRDKGLREIPSALNRLLVKGLSPDPSARHPSMAVLVNLLESTVGESSVSQGASSRAGWGRWFGATAALVLLVLVGVIWWLSEPLESLQVPLTPREILEHEEMPECPEGERYSSPLGRCILQDSCELSEVHTDLGCVPLPLAIREKAVRCKEGDHLECVALGEEFWDSADEVEYTVAVDCLEIACSSGSAKGCYLFGELMKRFGEDYQDERERLYALACDGGNSMACNDLGKLLIEGDTPKDPDRGLSLFSSACDKGLDVACANLATCYASGRGVEQDMKRAEALFKNSCTGGYGDSCFWLGSYFSKGKFVERDISLAARYFERGCELGDAASCQSYGNRRYDGMGVEEAPEEALKAFEKACALDDPDGCWNAAFMLQVGDGVTEDDARGRDFQKKGCEGGHAKSCFFEGAAIGAEGRLDEAKPLLQKACEGEHPEGCIKLAEIFRSEEAGRERSLALAREACTLGDLEGCHLLALWSLEGERDEVRYGIRELTSLCETLLYGESCLSLGDIYTEVARGERGLVQTQAMEKTSTTPGQEAMRFYQLACDLDNTPACLWLQELQTP